MIPFGPQLIGQAEKTLNALLARLLEGTPLDETSWIALRVASQRDGTVDLPELLTRSHVADATTVLADLAERGLVDEGGLTPSGRQLVADVRTRIGESTAAIWRDLIDEDVAATERVLNEVVVRGRALLTATG